jgi:hypothetical protein
VADEDSASDNEGWGWPANATKAHYFEGITSLCGRWMYTGRLDPDDGASKDDCVPCRKKLTVKKKAQST